MNLYLINYYSQNIYHLWHGSGINRAYNTRYQDFNIICGKYGIQTKDALFELNAYGLYEYKLEYRDEFNNIFTPVFTAGIDYHTFEMTIYNRWGEIVFETQDPQTGWDGSYGNQGLDVQFGVYTYKISFKTPQLDDRREILGHVNVVR